MEDTLVPVALFLSAAAVAITYVVLRARTQRLLIERGVSGGAYAEVLAAEAQLRKLSALKWGLVALGLGVAFVLIGVLGLHTGSESGPAAAGLLLIGAAAGLLAFWQLTRKDAGVPLVAATPAA